MKLCFDLHYSLYFIAALFTQFSSFKAKTGGPTKTTPAGKTVAANRSITGKPPNSTSNKSAPAKKDDKKPAAPRKDGELCIILPPPFLLHFDGVEVLGIVASCILSVR